jgi:hypothetical protein
MSQQGKAPSINYVMMKEETQVCPISILWCDIPEQVQLLNCIRSDDTFLHSFLHICHLFTLKA